MTQAQQNSSTARMAAAARRLIEGDNANLAEGRPSRTLFAANKRGDDFPERCAVEAALESGMGAVCLRYGNDMMATPRRANLAFIHNGGRLEARDCVLWSEEEGPMLLVPFDARLDHHFGIGPEGLELRPGRPAPMLGQGMSRARARLAAAARRQPDPRIVVVLSA